ncbi:MAG: glycosyl hydrolase family 18 protein [Candidatus Latescibacterota bacterium]|nr:glycosyl hydrolase family 18 protein [Candidatus Latescibacterota bacterium]
MWTLGIDVAKRRHRATEAHEARRPSDPSDHPITGEERVRISLPASGILRTSAMGSRRLRSLCFLPRWLTAVLLLVYSAPLSAAADEVWRGPHLSALEAHRQHPVLAELIGDGTRPTRPMRPAAKGTAARPVVFGFLPYWIDATYYYSIDWELLTHIAPFSVEVNTDGSLGDDRGWPWTALIDAAHARGVRVILTATLFGDSQVLGLIGDEARRQRFFASIRDAVLEGNADGVNIDFEGPGANGWPSHINGFLAELTAYLHAEIPGCEVSFAAPPVDWAGRWDYEGLAASCDYLFIMGYAFTGSWSERAGPTAPLRGTGRNITTTVTGDFGAVTRQHPEKLILGVPFYGCRWRTTSSEARASTSAFVDYPQFWATLIGAGTHGDLWDTASQTPWYRYREDGTWKQVWHDDPASLGLKFDLALEHGLRGVGMWALGYESHRVETWELLARKIGRRSAPTAVAAQAAEPAGLRLAPGYPNPFNGGAHLRAHLPGAGELELTIYDVLGRHVRRWRQDQAAAGPASWFWDGTDAAGRAVASGVYAYRLRYRDWGGTDRVLSRRLVLVR